MAMLHVGLDGEMSDSELALGAVLVQIGVALSPTEYFCSLIGHEPGTYRLSEAGMKAHGITVEEIAAAPKPAEVDAKLKVWLLERLALRGLSADAKRIVPVGFNVGGFDMPFVTVTLPDSSALLSRRVIDLNAFCLENERLGRSWGGSKPKWSGWKRLGNQYAAEQLKAAGIEEAWHSADYDALAAITMLDWLADPPQ